MLTVWSQRIRVLWLVIFVVVQFFRLQARRQRQNATLLWYALYRSDGGNGRQRVVQRAVNFLSALANITWWGGSAKGRRWADPRGEQWKIVQQRWPEDTSAGGDFDRGVSRAATAAAVAAAHVARRTTRLSRCGLPSGCIGVHGAAVAWRRGRRKYSAKARNLSTHPPPTLRRGGGKVATK